MKDYKGTQMLARYFIKSLDISLTVYMNKGLLLNLVHMLMKTPRGNCQQDLQDLRFTQRFIAKINAAKKCCQQQNFCTQKFMEVWTNFEIYRFILGFITMGQFRND